MPIASAKPIGHRFTALTFDAREVSRFRLVFTHAPGGFTGLTEVEAWGNGKLPYIAPPPRTGNIALNQTGQGFPKASASFHDVYGGTPEKAIDGRVNYKPTPINRWTSYGSPNKTDWFEVDFGTSKEVRRAELAIYDDRGGVQPPASYTIETFDGVAWREVSDLLKSPLVPAGSAVNTATFRTVTCQKLRIVFTHNGQSRSGLTELELRND
jgi:hypothetical protein